MNNTTIGRRSGIRIDATSLEIIKRLSGKRQSLAQIAEELQVSEGTVRNRINKLEEAGVLSRRGLVDVGALSGHMALLVGVKLTNTNFEDAAVAAEQRPGARMLRVACQARIMDARDPRMPGKEFGQALGIGADALHAQGQRFRADGQMVRRLRTERGAHVAQPLLADLRDAPERGVAFLVKIVELRVSRPVEAAGVGDSAAERIAVPADVLGQRIDDQRSADRPGPEEIRRGDRVVDDIKQAMRLAQLSDAL